MTDTTDIKALREHNQHIVAHLTRSNPSGPLSSAEVLTLESAKLIVAALSVRDGLPDADHSEYWFEHEGKLLFDGALFNSRVEMFISSQLEAAHQRAEAINQQYLRVVSERDDATDELEELRDELAALKGDQVPVGLVVGWDKHLDENIISWTREGSELPIGTHLFTATQKLIVLPALPLAIGEHTESAMKAVRRLDVQAIQKVGFEVKEEE